MAAAWRSPASSRASGSDRSSTGWRANSAWTAASATELARWRSWRPGPRPPSTPSPTAFGRTRRPGLGSNASWATALPAAAWPAQGSGVVIDESEAGTTAERLFPPDIATCDDCLGELVDPADRRFRYPFTNCTNCGPRATIIDDLPYDRDRTSMRAFPLCVDCDREYRDPTDRRFHAEPVACPRCGPRLSYRRRGEAAPHAFAEDALQAALADLRAGRVVAVKGLGGYHLACDATDPAAVDRLRDRKHRWAKPFAVMVGSLAEARAQARVSLAEADLLSSPARPIVLLDRRPDGRPALADTVVDAAGSGRDRRIGLFLPYTPLHHLLMEGFGRPIVLTSANRADEPLVTDDAEALERLAGLADGFLQHDREIRARYDDSVTRVVDGRESIIRRARGYAPDPLPLPVATPTPLLAVGAELKHTFTLAREGRAHVAPHIGDLEDLLTHRAFEHNLAHLERLLALDPAWVAHDLHPAYLLDAVRGRPLPAGATDPRPAPPRPRRLGGRRGRPAGPIHRRRLRRPGDGRRRHVLGRRGLGGRPGDLPAGGAVRDGPPAGGARWPSENHTGWL